MTLRTQEQAPAAPVFEPSRSPLDRLNEVLAELSKALSELPLADKRAALGMALGVFAAQEGIQPVPEPDATI